MGPARRAATAPREAGGARRRRAEESRQRILDSAARCFAEAGFRRTRFEDIAAGAGVSRALVYAYFESKENLLRRVCDQALEGWRAAVEPSFREAPDAARALAAMLRSTLLYARARPFLRALLGDDERGVLLGGDRLRSDAVGEWRRRLVELLERGQAEGVFRADLDVGATADVLRAMQLGILDRLHRPDTRIDVSGEAHVDAAVELVLRGVGAARSDAASG